MEQKGKYKRRFKAPVQWVEFSAVIGLTETLKIHQ